MAEPSLEPGLRTYFPSLIILTESLLVDGSVNGASALQHFTVCKALSQPQWSPSCFLWPPVKQALSHSHFANGGSQDPERQTRNQAAWRSQDHGDLALCPQFRVQRKWQDFPKPSWPWLNSRRPYTPQMGERLLGERQVCWSVH